jgi:hypothetical protein
MCSEVLFVWEEVLGCGERERKMGSSHTMGARVSPLTMPTCTWAEGLDEEVVVTWLLRSGLQARVYME